MNMRFALLISAVQLMLTSGQEDADLKTSCLLQKGVAVEQPQDMYSNEADTGSHAEYLRNALVMVRGLASNVTAWDTDLSQSERTSLDLIKSFIADLFESAVNSHDEDQKEVNRAKDLIAWCASTAKTSLTNDVGPLKSTMEGSRQDHSTCRTSEGGCQNHQNQACAEWEAYRKSNTPTECAGVEFKAQMGTQVESTKLDMEQCLRDLQPYYLKHIPCWQYKECVDGFAPLCDKNQTKFEFDYCGYSSQLSHTCQAQIDCRQKHIAFRDDTHADVRVNEAARKADYATGKKVLCYFKVFEAKNPNKSAILRDCDKLAVDTSKLDITYPGTPAPNPCVVEEKEPCKNGWEDVEYKNKKWTDHVTLLDCTPCPAPPPPGIKEMDDDCSGWSASLHHVIDGKCYMGAFDNRNRRITKTFSGLQAGCTYKWKAVIDTWASVDNEKMILTVNGAATNFKTRGAGDCNNGWTAYPSDFGDKVGSHGSSNGGWKDCWKNFEKEFAVPDSGNADVDMYFEIDQGISDEGWGWHDMMFQKVSCPGATPAQAGASMPIGKPTVGVSSSCGMEGDWFKVRGSASCMLGNSDGTPLVVDYTKKTYTKYAFTIKMGEADAHNGNVPPHGGFKPCNRDAAGVSRGSSPELWFIDRASDWGWGIFNGAWGHQASYQNLKGSSSDPNGMKELPFEVTMKWDGNHYTLYKWKVADDEFPLYEGKQTGCRPSDSYGFTPRLWAYSSSDVFYMKDLVITQSDNKL